MRFARLLFVPSPVHIAKVQRRDQTTMMPITSRGDEDLAGFSSFFRLAGASGGYEAYEQLAMYYEHHALAS